MADESNPEREFPIERVRSTLEEHSVRLAILFGSHATGRAHSDSDVDIAVELDGATRGLTRRFSD